METWLSETCRKVELNILRSSVHLVCFIWKRLYRDVRSTKHFKKKPLFPFVHSSQSRPNKNKPRPKIMCWKDLIFLFCPGCEVKWSHPSLLLSVSLCNEYFQIHSKYSLRWASRHSTLTSCISCWLLQSCPGSPQEVIPQFL